MIRFLLSTLILLLCSCNEFEDQIEFQDEVYAARTTDIKALYSLESGKSYLSVYPEIYSISEHKKHSLTVIASIKNISLKDTLYIQKAEYYDTNAKLVHTYIDRPIYVSPLETIEIVIDEIDLTGGTGANFIFEWKIKPKSSEPFFEGIMISTYSTQGLSFTTQGKRIE